jgi:4-hydroxybenzoate polyprenyltransferase
VGVKSTALRFGDSTKEWITGFGIASISSLALSGFNAGIGMCYISCICNFLLTVIGLIVICFFGKKKKKKIVEQGGHIMHFWQLHLDN